MIWLPHLETNVTVACQKRCVACNHFVPLQVRRFKQSMIPPEVLARDLRNFGRIAHTGAWAAIGGEPLLHPELPELLRIAKRSGVADVIEVWTNGLAMEDRSCGFLAHTDRLVVSVYPGFPDGLLIDIKACTLEMGVELVVKDERSQPNFTQLLVPEGDTRETIQRRYEQCWFKTYSRVLDFGYFYRCCTSPFIPPLLMGLSWGFDGLWIDEETTEADLNRFLANPQYMPSCVRCAGRETPEAVPVPWREVPVPHEWIEASGGGS